MWQHVYRLKIAEQIGSKSEVTEDDAAALSEQLKADVAAHYRDDRE